MTIPASVLSRWSRFEGASVRPFGTGLINKTFLVQRTSGRTSGRTDERTGERTGEYTDERAILQRLHPVFAGTVNEDIDAVTRHLAGKGLPTPRLLPADDGALFVVDTGTSTDPDAARPWRALSFVDGTSVDRVDTPQRAFEGAALVARFHLAVADLAWRYRHVRAGVHDIAKHRATLEAALAAHAGHRLLREVEPLARALLRAAGEAPDFSALPARHCHGDLKISNLLFDASGRGLCLVDLDTLALMAWPLEMGDALRSWCNPAGEDVTDAALDVTLFRAAVEGYASARATPDGAGAVMPAERDLLVGGLHAICVELAMRFLADALNESYFGWDPSRFATRGDHNLLRARGQWSLAQSVAAQRGALEEMVRRALKPA